MRLSWMSACVLLATACSSAAPADGSGPSESDLTAEDVQLPAEDKCRDVLAPLARGLAEGSIGRTNTLRVDVTATSETEVRDYAVRVDGKPFTVNGTTFDNDAYFDVTLDNDSSSKCLVLAVKPRREGQAPRPSGAAPATPAEASPEVPVTLPADDDCASTITLLAQAAAVSALQPSHVESVAVTLDSETWERVYAVHVDGTDFEANGMTFANTWDFRVKLDNDSSFGCWPLELVPVKK